MLVFSAPSAQAGTGGSEERSYASLQQLSRSYGFRSMSVYGKTVTLLTRFHSLELEKDSRKAQFDGITVWLNGPVEKSWGRWLILQRDVEKTVLPLINPYGALSSEGYGVVVLDAGHGGEDKGASMPRQGVEEKQITLDLAKRVSDILKLYHIDVRLTRTEDRQVTLDERDRLAETWDADLFISIHLNSANTSKPSGIEIHILPPVGYPITADPSVNARDRITYPGNKHDRANMVLGYALQKSLLKHTQGEDRGIRRSRFYVIRNVSCPAVLVECGFLSNRNERQKILAKSYRNDIARGIAEGIITYLNTVKRARHLNP